MVSARKAAADEANKKAEEEAAKPKEAEEKAKASASMELLIQEEPASRPFQSLCKLKIGVSKFLIPFLIESTFQYDTHHVKHNNIDICAVFDLDIVLFQLSAHKLPRCRFLWCVIFPCHK